MCYDLKYALRLCLEHDHKEACVHIYSTMGLYEEAVHLALQVSSFCRKHSFSVIFHTKMFISFACKFTLTCIGYKTIKELLRTFHFLSPLEAISSSLWTSLHHHVPVLSVFRHVRGNFMYCHVFPGITEPSLPFSLVQHFS